MDVRAMQPAALHSLPPEHTLYMPARVKTTGGCGLSLCVYHTKYTEFFSGRKKSVNFEVEV